MVPHGRLAEQVRSILAFAESLQRTLLEETANIVVHGSIRKTLGEQVNVLLSLPPVDSLPERMQLDSLGIEIWNICTRIMRKRSGKEEEIDFLCHARVFAFFMLESSSPGDQECVNSDNIRLLKVALKTTKTCLELNQLDIGLKVLEKAAIREEELTRLCKSLHADGDLTCRLSAEYYILRVALSWRQGRLDLAEHMFSKLSAECLKKNPSTAENLADLLYDIGKSLLSQDQHTLAARWLQRSYEAVSQHSLEKLSLNAGDLRFCILHGLVRANLALQTQDTDGELVSNLFNTLEHDYGNKLPVVLLKLEIIGKQASPDCQKYYESLCVLLRIAPLAELTFKIMVRHIHQLRTWSAELAAEAMQQLLLQRLILCEGDDRVEKCLVTYIWMMTARPNLSDGLESLKAVVAKVSASWPKTLSPEATHASVILLWKKVDTAFRQKEYSIAEEWCLLAQHPIFENAGPTNKSKLKRKLILCALESFNTERAQHIIGELSESCKSEPLTRYLMYKTALRGQDLDSARECLEFLCKQNSQASNYILACVAEAQDAGNRHQAALALQRLVGESYCNALDGIHLPALLRCSARLLMLELKSSHAKNSDIVEHICNVFESSVVHAMTFKVQSCDSPFSILELEWFSRNSYNLALQFCTIWDPQPIMRLLNSCIKLIDLYPTNLDSEVSDNLALRRLLCDFLGAIITMAQARIQVDCQLQRDHYLDSRTHIQSFRGSLEAQLARSGDDARAELLDKYRTLLAFDFEAAVRLKQWNSLGELIDESKGVADDELYGIFADATLCSDAPIEESARVFQSLIQTIRKTKSHDTSKLFRWIRCLFQLAIDSNVQIAEEVLDQAYALARDGQPSLERQLTISVSRHYPEEELEWLSTTAFNRAVDFYLSSDDVASKRWGQKALDMAELLHDKGTLYQVLKGKFGCLKWDS